MKVIVGLGNPGAKYRGTRLNIGFAVLDELARRANLSFDAARVDALTARWRDRDTLLAKPMTFMNESGEAVGALLRYFKVEQSDLLVVVDEVQLPLARLRARARGSAGGHNGLKSIVAHLAKFDQDEAAEVERMTTRAADAAEMFITSGIAAVMNGYNGGDPATSE